jgi:hypothetical protein
MHSQRLLNAVKKKEKLVFSVAISYYICGIILSEKSELRQLSDLTDLILHFATARFAKTRIQYVSLPFSPGVGSDQLTDVT